MDGPVNPKSGDLDGKFCDTFLVLLCYKCGSSFAI